jgi:predicted enzyme related to lactoylglutathione lyase
MTLRIQCLTIDATNPSELARFWEKVLGWRVTEDDGNEVVVEPLEQSPNSGLVPDLLFLKVPETKIVKNRLHIDLRPDDQNLEVKRLEELGARRINVGQSDEVTWVVLADPEGNEFCVLRALD